MIQCDNIKEELIYRVPLIIRSLYRDNELNNPEQLSKIIDNALETINNHDLDSIFRRPDRRTISVNTDTGKVTFPELSILTKSDYLQLRTLIQTKIPGRKLRKTIILYFYAHQ